MQTLGRPTRPRTPAKSVNRHLISSSGRSLVSWRSLPPKAIRPWKCFWISVSSSAKCSFQRHPGCLLSTEAIVILVPRSSKASWGPHQLISVSVVALGVLDSVSRTALTEFGDGPVKESRGSILLNSSRAFFKCAKRRHRCPIYSPSRCDDPLTSGSSYWQVGSPFSCRTSIIIHTARCGVGCRELLPSSNLMAPDELDTNGFAELLERSSSLPWEPRSGSFPCGNIQAPKWVSSLSASLSGSSSILQRSC